MQTEFTLAQLADPAIAEAEHPAQMRALRLLHGDLPTYVLPVTNWIARAGASI